MWIKASGPLGSNTYQCTTPVTTHLLATGAESALFDAGVLCFGNRLADQIDPIRYLFLSHGHFDHIGALPVLRNRFPNLNAVGSKELNEILHDDSYLRSVYDRNQTIADSFSLPVDELFEGWRSGMHLDSIVGEGDHISLGADVTVSVIRSSGHTSDNLAFFVRPDGVLAAGECLGGFYGGELVVPCFLDQFESYVNTIRKLRGMSIRSICLGHSGTLTGSLVAPFLKNAENAALTFREQIQAHFRQGLSANTIVTTLLHEWTNAGFAPDGPFRSSQAEALARMIELCR